MSYRQSPDWKRGGAPSGRASVKNPDWRPPGETRPPRKGLTRKEKLFFYGGGLGLLLALIVVVVYYLIPGKPAAFAFFGADYRDNPAVPHNAYGWQGLQGLAEGIGGGGFRALWHKGPVKIGDPEAVTSAKDWSKKLAGAAINQETVVLFFDLHGGADEGGAYFLVDSKGGQEKLYLKQVLDDLDKIDGLRDKNKLLLIDATKVMAHAPHFIHNDFVRGLKELMKERVAKDDERLAIICASGVDQRSWVSEEWGCSVFFQKVKEGIEGKAQEDNGRVTALSLFKHVAKEVREWARARRGALQTPIVLPEGAEERLSRWNLAVLNRGEAAADAGGAGPKPADFPPEWLTKCWLKHENLRASSPPPEAYAPHLWRRYQAALLRCEDLARAGHAEAENLSRGLDDLEREIREAGRLDPGAAGYSLAPPRPFGRAAALTNEQMNRCLQLWARQGTDDERAKIAQGLLKEETRLAVYDWLLDRLQKPAEGEDVVKAAGAFLDELKETGRERPAEVMLLTLLSRSLPDAKRPGDLVRMALRVRRQAEEVAWSARPVPAGKGERPAPAYAERVLPWTSDLVGRADAKRCLAEDHLFSADEADWKKAEDLLGSAEKDYEDAAKDAAVVRAALWVCDEAHAALPYYGQWLANSDLARDKESLHPLYEKVLGLWDVLHALDAEAKSSPPPDAKERGSSLAGLTKKTALVRAGLRDVAGGFDTHAADLLERKAQAENWREIDDALLVPFSKNRAELLRHERTISKTLHDQDDPGAVRAKAPDEEKERERAHEAAQRQWHLALAALGIKGGDEANDDVWSQKYRHRSAYIARAWHNMAEGPEGVAELVKKAQEREGTSADAFAALGRAERLSRLADPSLPLEDNPAQRLRRLQAHAFLLWQARRTLSALCWGERKEATATPYFKTVAGAFVKDANGLVPAADASQVAKECVAKAKDLQAALDGRDMRMTIGLLVEGKRVSDTAGVLMTGEPEFTLRHIVDCELPLPPGVVAPSGRAAVRLETDALHAKFTEKDEKNKKAVANVQNRRLLDLGKDAPDDLAVTLNNPHPFRPVMRPETHLTSAPEPIKTAVKAVGFFRGLEFSRETSLEVRAAADTIAYQHPAPARVSAVAMTPDDDVLNDFKNKRNIVVIVLDLSGSMKEPYKDGKRIDAARKALRDVLGQVPDNTAVSVIVFGQKLPTESYTVEDTVQVRWEARLWKKKQHLDELMKKVNLTPYTESPIVRAMWRSKEEFHEAEKLVRENFGAAAVGKKTLLVLTDGDDNRFEKEDADLRKKLEVDKIHKAVPALFAGQDISVNMVVFQSDEKELRKAREQFKHVIEEALDPPGAYYDQIDSTEELTRRIGDAMGLRLTYKLRQKQREDAVARPLGSVRLQDLEMRQDPNWYCFPSRPYDAYVKTQRLKARIDLASGDALLLRLTPEGLRRGVMKDFTELNKNFLSDEKDQWTLTVLQNERVVQTGAQVMLAAVEKAPDTKADPVQQVRPQEVWFEVNAGAGGKPPGLCWGNAPGFPAPAWELRLPRFAESATVKAWVRESETVSNIRPLSRLPGTEDLRKQAYRGEVGVAGGTVDFAVRVEQLEVPAPGGAKGEPQWCLVIRADYETRHPFFARASGITLDRGGYEHHFYDRGEASRYTGVFWFGGASPEAVGDKARDLQFVSLESLKDPSATPLAVGKLPGIAPGHRPQWLNQIRDLNNHANKSRPADSAREGEAP